MWSFYFEKNNQLKLCDQHQGEISEPTNGQSAWPAHVSRASMIRKHFLQTRAHYCSTSPADHVEQVFGGIENFGLTISLGKTKVLFQLAPNSNVLQPNITIAANCQKLQIPENR
ncbi:hypothetical protein ElyMa_002348600 [Elysia marginata]|uniref:Uncharacterized protein n=1 Tax=Elysia marginata TaxID=1093978 RepID=A0AAV4G9X2_9GAST|nr:hypothetical protein ElyMa_002348600 [Elysia marginata]